MSRLRVIPVVINNNHREGTIARLRVLMGMREWSVEICLIDRGCLKTESMINDLKQYPKITYYERMSEMATLSEVRNMALCLVKKVNYDWIWFVADKQVIKPEPIADLVIGESGMMVKKQVAGAIGEFENRFYGGMEEYDWVFRAEQQGFKVFGESTKDLEKLTGLQAYFWGRNPWFMIKLRLKGKWWIKKGRKIRRYWLEKLVKVIYQGSGEHLKLFFNGTVDGWRIMLNKN